MSGNRSKSAFFEGGVGHFERRFQREWGVADKPLLVSSSRVIALLCGIKISAVRHLVLSQSTRVTDRRTDRITTPKTALAYARAVKTHCTLIRPPCTSLTFSYMLTVLLWLCHLL